MNLFDKLLLLAAQINSIGYKKISNNLYNIFHKVAASTRCVAVLKYPISFAGGQKLSMFNYKTSSEIQMISAIPHILSKKHKQVFYCGRKYELPAQEKIMAARLLEDFNNGQIVCECYIGEE